MKKYYVFYDSRKEAIQLGKVIEDSGNEFFWVNEVGKLISIKELEEKSNKINYTPESIAFGEGNLKEIAKDENAIFIIDLALNQNELKDSENRFFKAFTAKKIIEILRKYNPKAIIKIISSITNITVADKWKKSLDISDQPPEEGTPAIKFLMRGREDIQLEWKPEQFR